MILCKYKVREWVKWARCMQKDGKKGRFSKKIYRSNFIRTYVVGLLMFKNLETTIPIHLEIDQVFIKRVFRRSRNCKVIKFKEVSETRSHRCRLDQMNESNNLVKMKRMEIAVKVVQGLTSRTNARKRIGILMHLAIWGKRYVMVCPLI